ncbi:MAG: esterase-like activity of phytase family protein [Paracoccaceae bacterium]
MRRARLAVALAFGAIAGAAAADPAAEGSAVRVSATEVAITGDLGGVRLLGAWSLDADDTAFGGLSGAVLAGERLIAVGDRGIWFSARFDPGGDGPLLADARLASIRGGGGAALGGKAADAEALAMTCGGGLAVGFEQFHRLRRYGPDGRLRAVLDAPSMAGDDANAGIEGLATDPGDCDAVLAIDEDASADGHAMLLAGPEGTRAEGRLTSFEDLSVTAAAFGPDGALYTLRRSFSPFTGLDVALVRHPPYRGPLPEGGGEVLARFGSDSGIDNMEALAAWTDAEGRLRLLALSDDNFNPLQRTLLLDFLVE